MNFWMFARPEITAPVKTRAGEKCLLGGVCSPNSNSGKKSSTADCRSGMLFQGTGQMNLAVRPNKFSVPNLQNKFSVPIKPNVITKTQCSNLLQTNSYKCGKQPSPKSMHSGQNNHRTLYLGTGVDMGKAAFPPNLNLLKNKRDLPVRQCLKLAGRANHLTPNKKLFKKYTQNKEFSYYEETINANYSRNDGHLDLWSSGYHNRHRH